ncbi:regulatory protein TenI [Ruminiclostridium hungatei]|uniref:Regulatory protein TenI n=1 Tax=Ruminiclostridium hungatei TaxID=48256 RepID=A0A1V4SKR8_RUMHU|nr:thiamine phosphate synthase [Ruminiclostridium hungatei]OPX44488.1 regulatory protein TenI [Ruminiclostridium hungatei]
MLIIVTDRKLCRDHFLDRIRQLAREAGPRAILLREKDMEDREYALLARQINSICLQYKVDFIVNHKVEVALSLKLPYLHLSMPELRQHRDRISTFRCTGASVHSAQEALEAQSLGAGYLIAGHVFPTECKKELAPRGLDFLREVCGAVHIPVYAIGGMTVERSRAVLEAGAGGVCVMSEAMTCVQPSSLSAFNNITGF